MWLKRKKRGEDENTKSEYLENEKSFLDEMKNPLSFFIPPFFRKMQAPLPPHLAPLDTHHRNIPISMMIHRNQGG